MHVTFSAQVKQELCKQPLSRRCCAQAEAYGILLYCNTFQPRQVRIITESPQLKQRLPLLFRKAFRVEFDVVPTGEGKGSFLIEDPENFSLRTRRSCTSSLTPSDWSGTPLCRCTSTLPIWRRNTARRLFSEAPFWREAR